MLSWFKVDIHVRNDPKVRAVRAKYGPAGLGYLLGLWSYVATEGSKTDPGVGVKADGTPLDLEIMAADLGFDAAGSLRDFLAYLAGIHLIDADTWSQGTVILPAMRSRMAEYRKSKGRTPTGRPPGRPRKNPIQGPETPAINSGVQGRVSGEAQEIQGTPGVGIAEIPKETTRPEIAGNSGETPGNSGNSSSLVLSDLPDLQLEPDKGSDDQNDDPRIGKLTVKKLVRLWNELRVPGPKVLGVVPARYERFRLAIKATPDVADWERAIGYLNGANWANACGEGTHANFRADLDYLAKPGNVTKALERLAAKDLPTARPARHTGRVAPTGNQFRAAIDAQKAEDEAFRKAGTS
jgi:hypothetical protein